MYHHLKNQYYQNNADGKFERILNTRRLFTTKILTAFHKKMFTHDVAMQPVDGSKQLFMLKSSVIFIFKE